MSDKTLLIFSPGFAADEADSTCLPAQQQLILSINKTDPSLKIIILAFQYPFINASYSWNGNQVIAFGGENKKQVYRVLLWLRIWRKLKQLKKKENITGILCFWYGECSFLGKLFAKRNDLHCVTWLLGQDARPGNKYIRWMRPRPENIVAISDAVIKAMEKNYGIKPAYMIPNAVTPALFTEYTGPRDIDLLGVGSLIPLKRYDLFIEAVKNIMKQLPAVKAMICGKGEEKERLIKLIADHGLSDTISLSGELPYPQVLQLMQRSKILLHPSAYEGFSGVCLEALYAGAHVISFCNPKDAWIRHWHIVDNVEEMTASAYALLADKETAYRPVLPYTMDDSARSFINLFS